MVRLTWVNHPLPSVVYEQVLKLVLLTVYAQSWLYKFDIFKYVAFGILITSLLTAFRDEGRLNEKASWVFEATVELLVCP